MIRRHVWTSVICFSIAVFALQCGDDAEDTDTDTGTPEDSENEPDAGDTDTGGSEEDVIKGTLVIPEDFDGTPVAFATMFVTSLDTNGMPDAFGDSFSGAEIEGIVAGGTFEFTSTQAGLEGEYHMTLVVYCEGGGGGGVPISGTDWVGASDKLTLGPGTGEVDAGDIQLISF